MKKRGSNKKGSFSVTTKSVSKKNRSSSVKNRNGHGDFHPIFHQKLTLGQRTADAVAKFGGSWVFIIIFFVFLFGWMMFNTWFLIRGPFDPYPFILLNLVLSSLAAIQAPIILMSQNRQAERDRIDAKYDHQVNRKAEREIQLVQKELRNIRQVIHDLSKKL